MAQTQAAGRFTAERLEALERTSSRVLFVGGLVALALGAIVSEDRKLPPTLVLAWIGVFVLVKAVLAVLGVRAGWRVWPALLAEIGAFLVVGWIVRNGLALGSGDMTGIALALLTAVLLGAAGLLRRRAAQS